MRLRWLIFTNTDPIGSSRPERKLQYYTGDKDGQSLREALNDNSNWEDVEEVNYDWRK